MLEKSLSETVSETTTKLLLNVTSQSLIEQEVIKCCDHQRWGYVWDGEDYVSIQYAFCPKCGEKL